MQNNELVNKINNILNKRITKVRIFDLSFYKAGYSNDGGCYSFWSSYTRQKNGKFKRTYHTSSEIPYCDRCGNWGEHNHYYECSAKYEYFNLKEIKDIIVSWLKDCLTEPSKYSMEIEFEDGSIDEY